MLLLSLATVALATFDPATLQGTFKGEVISVKGPGVGLNAGREEIIHVSFALKAADGSKGVLVSSGGATDRPYKYNSNREIGHAIAMKLEADGKLAELGLEGPSYQLNIAGLPFPFAPTNLIPWMGDQTKDVGLHVSLYNQPPSGQYGAKYTAPTEEDVAKLAAAFGEVTVTTDGIVLLNGSELNDDKAGGAHYVGLAATDATTTLARKARELLGLKVDMTQKFHITIAISAPRWKDHRKAGLLSINDVETAAGQYVGEVDGAVLGTETLAPAAHVMKDAGKYPNLTSNWVLFRRGAGVRGPGQFDKPAAPVETTPFAGWDNDSITGWTKYCDDANAISAENNAVKGRLMRDGEKKALADALGKLKKTEAQDMTDEIRAEIADKDVNSRMPEIFETMAAETRDILDVLGFPLAVGPNEEGRTRIVAPDLETQALLVIELMGERTPADVFQTLERVRAAKASGVASSDAEMTDAEIFEQIFAESTHEKAE